MIPFVLQGQNIVLYVNGAPVIVDSSHVNYKIVKEAILAGDWDTVKEMATVKAAVKKASNGRVSVSEDEVLFDGKIVHNALSRRMIQMFSEGFPIAHFCKFMENLDANPSYRARNELYGFLEACDLPITDDGCFLAYKKIRSDWKDVYTGTIDNSIGAKPTMNRRDVNEDPNQTCSAGLHVCSYSYLKSYSGERIVAVKVNPADVVAVPIDYNNAKMRVSQYEVVEELPFTAAQESDTLSAGPSVRTGYAQKLPAMETGIGPLTQSLRDMYKPNATFKVEDVLPDLSQKEFDELCQYLQVNANLYYDSYAREYDTLSLMDDVRVGEIRKAIIALKFV